MTDELWRHALKTLDHYRTESDISQLYKHEDPTGILEKHKKMVSSSRTNVEPKAMYFELIKMLLDHERGHCKPEAYRQVKEVSKIQGYQDLTNRLLRNINERLVKELQGVCSKLNRLERVVGLASDEIDGEYDEIDGALPNWSEKFAKIETVLEHQGTTLNNVEAENNRQNEDIANMLDKIKARDEIDSDAKNMQDEQVKIQTEALAILERRIDSNEEHIELLEKHDMEQDQILSALEVSMPNIEQKLTALESADTFLQESHKLAMEKSHVIEEDGKLNGQTLDKLTFDFKTFQEAKNEADDKTLRMMENLTEKEDKLAEAVDELNKENSDIKSKLEELNGNTNNLEEKALDLLNELNRAKDVFRQMETQQGEGIEGAKAKIDEIDALIRKLTADMESLREETDKSSNGINNLNDVTSNHKDQLERIEGEAATFAETIWLSINENRGDADGKFETLFNDVRHTSDKVNEIDNNNNIMVAKIESLEGSNQERASEISRFSVEYGDRIYKLEEGQRHHGGRIDEAFETVHWHSEKLGNLEPVIHATSDKIIDIYHKLDEKDKWINNVAEDLSRTNESNLRQDQEIDELKKSNQALGVQVEDVEDRSKNNLERIVGIEEQSIIHMEKATYVEKLQSQVYMMDEQKQQSEAKMKEELDQTSNMNRQHLDELKKYLEDQLEYLKEKSNGHGDQIGGLWESNTAVERGLKSLSDSDIQLNDKIALMEKKKEDLALELEKLMDSNHHEIEAITSRLSRIDDNNNAINDKVYRALEPLTNENKEAIIRLEKGLETVPLQMEERLKVKGDDVDRKMDEKMEVIGEMMEKNEKHVDNLRDLNSKLISQLQDELTQQKETLDNMKDENTNDFNNLKEKVHIVMEILAQVERGDLEELLKARKVIEEKLNELELDAKDGKESLKTTHNSLNAFIIEIKNELDKSIENLDFKVADNFAQIQDKELRDMKKDIDEARDCNRRYDNQLESVNNLIQNVQVNMLEVSTQFQDGDTTLKQIVKTLRKDVEGNRNDLWNLITEVYAALRGYTVVLRSTGSAAENQPACLGVYRMVDSVEGRPVYKQDGGENYLYYGKETNSWQVGTNVGAPYAWIKNDSESSDESSSSSSSSSDGEEGHASWSDEKSKGKKHKRHRSRITTPDLLKSGWKYKPMALELSTQFDDGDDPMSWFSDDSTLRVEALRDVEMIGDLIREIQNSREID